MKKLVKLKELYKEVDYYFNAEKDIVYNAIDNNDKEYIWELAVKSYQNLEKFLEVLDYKGEIYDLKEECQYL